MLAIYRRHLRGCPHRSKGRSYRRCRCPIWVDGTTRAGKEIRKTTGLRNWDQAEQLRREWENDVLAPASPAPSSPHEVEPQPVMLARVWQSFLADLEARNLRASTLRKYRLLARSMQEFAVRRGMPFLKQFDLAALRDFRAEWHDGPLSSTKKLERLRAFYRFAQDNEWVQENLARKLKAAKVSQRPTLPFTHEEMVRILAALNPLVEQAAPSGKDSARRLRALILVLRYSGMRIGDVVKLTTDKINGNKLFLYTQKTGVPVFTVLPDFAVRALDATPRVAAKHYFWTGAGNPDGAVGSWRKRLRKLFQLANVSDGHAHRFRDTFATELLLAGVPIERVAILLGHQSVKITEKYYAAWTDSRQRQVEADLQRAWERDPLVLLETKGTQGVRGKDEVVN